ncbi:MAG: hypothetical protein DFNUSKGM_002759, partial [Candidatus Fervidibacter sacchari]
MDAGLVEGLVEGLVNHEDVFEPLQGVFCSTT